MSREKPLIFKSAGLDLNLENRTLYENMAHVLSGVTTAPRPRLTFWSAWNGRFNGWYASIKAVADNGKGGHLVDVLVEPEMGSMIVSSSYSEQWDVDVNGKPTFVKSFDPEGMAGQMPTIVVQ